MKKRIVPLLGLFLLTWPFHHACAQQVLTDADLASMASPPLSSLPLGDQRYTTDWARRGYIYLCHLPREEEGGAQLAGPWIHGASWDPHDKPFVGGHVSWGNAVFSATLSDGWRTLAGNGLPISHPTGTFPVMQDDEAFRYDHNPNSIRAQTVKDVLPVAPIYSVTPFCMGMESGVMLSGVPLFNGFDAGLRDAAAHELQDRCAGHPQVSGQYHYHSLSPCLKDLGVKDVIGYALDGFPITGPLVSPGRYLHTDVLDECHGITSEIVQDGQKKISYHYVMTEDFPYSVGCFHAQPIRTGPAGGRGMQIHGGQPQGGAPSPPAEAINACINRNDGLPCDFMTPRGDMISGTCRRPMGQDLACVPAQR